MTFQPDSYSSLVLDLGYYYKLVRLIQLYCDGWLFLELIDIQNFKQRNHKNTNNDDNNNYGMKKQPKNLEKTLQFFVLLTVENSIEKLAI